MCIWWLGKSLVAKRITPLKPGPEDHPPMRRDGRILMEVAMGAWLTLLPMMFWNFVWLVAAIVCALWTYDTIRGR